MPAHTEMLCTASTLAKETSSSHVILEESREMATQTVISLRPSKKRKKINQGCKTPLTDEKNTADGSELVYLRLVDGRVVQRE